MSEKITRIGLDQNEEVGAQMSEELIRDGFIESSNFFFYRNGGDGFDSTYSKGVGRSEEMGGLFSLPLPSKNIKLKLTTTVMM